MTPVELYYHAGKVNRDLCAAYTMKKIAYLGCRRKHCGPFIPPREPCIDWDETNRRWVSWEGIAGE